ncbi:MAG TPA: hypothetical protein VK007_02580 [Acidimicrobiales bacterium]|nr:hypothetical protein [Acidimicrobiales bacterium]
MTRPDRAGARRVARARSGLGWLGALAVLLVVAAACAGGEAPAGPPDDVEVVVPAGTGARLRAGEDVTVMPERLVLQVGQTLRIRNEDGEAARVGPYEVPARDELSVRFGRPGRFEGYCPLSENDRYEIVIEG